MADLPSPAAPRQAAVAFIFITVLLDMLALGALSSVQMVTGLIGPALFSETFATFISTRRTSQLPGAPYLLSSLLLVIGLLLAVHVTKPAATI